jgi:hypothetical protein
MTTLEQLAGSVIPTNVRDALMSPINAVAEFAEIKVKLR